MICADKGKFGAVCVYTRGDEQVTQVPKLEWDRMRVGWFAMNPKALGDYQQFVETACLKDKNCVDGVRRVVDGITEKKNPWGEIREATPEEIERAKRQYETGHALRGTKQ